MAMFRDPRTGRGTLLQPARRAGCELASLEDADVDSGLGEVEGDARADDPATDDDDVGALGEDSPPDEVAQEEPDVRGRSASRRMRYGYQSGPNGVATSTL